MDDLRRTTVGAVGLSFTLVCLLLLFVMNVAEKRATEAGLLVSSVGILLMTCLTIYLWIRCARKYIDYAIDRKLASGGR